jgi:hypothetical protein
MKTKVIVTVRNLLLAAIGLIACFVLWIIVVLGTTQLLKTYLDLWIGAAIGMALGVVVVVLAVRGIIAIWKGPPLPYKPPEPWEGDGDTR